VISKSTRDRLSLINKKNYIPVIKEPKKCLNCGEEHNNKNFCSYSCSCSYHNRIRIISDSTKTKLSLINKGKIGYKHSEEVKKLLSQKLKKYYKEHPEKHNWSKCDKTISKPCEFLKNNLRNKNIFFIEELKPLDDYNYSIDIAFPEYKIGIEVNGNQHYAKGESDLILKDYYQKRHDLIEDDGWKLIELHYKTVYDKNIDLIINKILNEKKIEYDIKTKNYLIDSINRKFFCKICGEELNNDKKCIKCKEEKNKKKVIEKKVKLIKTDKYNLCKCGKRKLVNSLKCKECNKNRVLSRKADRPSYDILIEEVKNFGYSAIGRKYGVSGNAIKKWLN
jgi:very-short-patch-repair endonuclease